MKMCSSLSHTNRCSASVRRLILCKVERLKGAGVGKVFSRPCIYQTRSYLCTCMCGEKKCGVAELRICGFVKMKFLSFIGL